VSRCSKNPLSQAGLFDHLVGAAEERDWNGDAERLCRFEIDYQIDFGGL